MRARGRAARMVVIVAVAVCAVPTAAYADTYAASDDDPANLLWDCANRHVPFGDTGQDVLRCLSFHVEATKDPAKLKTAVLYLDIAAPTNSLQDTDTLNVAVGEPFADCAWGQGGMPGCVVVHGGFAGGERSLVVDLLNVACDPAAPPVTPEEQQAIRDAIATGTVHVMLQDDTAVNGAWLDIDGDPAPQCGTSDADVPAPLIQRAKAPSPTGSTTTDDGGGGGPPVVPIVLGVGALALAGAGATAAQQRSKARQATKQVQVSRRPDPGAVDLDTRDEDGPEPTVAVGVRTAHDDGVLTIEEDRP